ncbi:MAG: hypothetical protein ICV64_02765 [Thermoleophilia bacterium]|nr:hypothetical protein [Thermoleophilia bacterium]
MKRSLAAGIAATLAVAALAVPAPAATPNQRIAQLERQMRAQQRLVRTQQREITRLKRQVTETRDVLLGTLLFSVCSTAITADALMSTWGTINQVEQRTVVGPQAPVSDPACSRLQVPRTQQVPPSLNAFAQLLRLVNQPFSAFSAFSTVFRHQ